MQSSKEEFSGDFPEELFFSDSTDEELEPIIVELKEWFLTGDVQSLSGSKTKLEPEQWNILCDHVLCHLTQETVALLPAFLSGKTLELSLNCMNGDTFVRYRSKMSSVEAMLSKICLDDFILEDDIPIELINHAFPFLMQQPISQELIDLLFSTICFRQSPDFDFAYHLLENLLQSRKILPATIQSSMNKKYLIEFYEKFLVFNSIGKHLEFLPLPIEYKQEALNNLKQKMLFDETFSTGTDSANTLLTQCKKYEETLANEKLLHRNSYLKLWLFSQVNEIPKDIKPAIRENMRDLYEDECNKLSKKL